MDYRVSWDTDSETVTLPNPVFVPDYVAADEVADWISEQYGWCVESLEKVPGPRFVREGSVIVDTTGLHGENHHGLDPAIIDFAVRCYNSADAMMRCTGSVSASTIEADPRGTGIDYRFYVDRYTSYTTEANR